MIRLMNPASQPPAPPAAAPPLPPSPMGASPSMPQDDGGPDDAPMSKGRYDVQKVSPDISGYMGPESGPFQCSRCMHFEGPSSCAIVQGSIDPAGCCNLFDTGTDNNASDEPDSDDDSTQGLLNGLTKAQGPTG